MELFQLLGSMGKKSGYINATVVQIDQNCKQKELIAHKNCWLVLCKEVVKPKPASNIYIGVYTGLFIMQDFIMFIYLLTSKETIMSKTHAWLQK